MFYSSCVEHVCVLRPNYIEVHLNLSGGKRKPRMGLGKPSYPVAHAALLHLKAD